MKQKRKRKSSKKNSKKSKGSALLLATILLFVVLGMVVSLSYITVMEQKMSGKTKSSVGAFFNADSGIEWALNKIVSSSGKISNVFGTSTPGNGIDCPDFGSGSPCKIYLLDTNGKVITDSNTDLSEVKAVRSVGSQGGETTRAIEAAVAQSAGGKASYVSYWNNNNSGYCLSGFSDQGKLGDLSRCGFYYGSADSISIFGDQAVCNGPLSGNVYAKYGEAHLCVEKTKSFQSCYVSYFNNSGYCLSGFSDQGKLGDLSRCGFYYGSADSISIFGDQAVCNGPLSGNVYAKYGEAHLCCQ